MDIKVTHIDIDTNSITPSLVIATEITYYYNQEAPFSISGRIITSDGKTVAIVNEYQINREVSIGLKVLDKETRDVIYGSGGKYRFSYEAHLTSFLSPNAIDHIERLREENLEKEVVLNFGFIVKYLNTPSDQGDVDDVKGHAPLISIQARNFNHQFKIKQSDWINKYSSLLGIGNFLLLELQIPSRVNVEDAWIDLYERLILRIKEMLDAIRHGDWQKTMTKARQFYENLKFDSRFIGQQELKDRLKELFIQDQHSAEGFEEFNKGISSFFNYTSKFIHDKDRVGQLNPVPIPRKEDAYFVYSLAIGLVNVIGRKICR
ncbi:MAG TPA: hypothetical protein VF487_12410 [Chitinophagaceae bacterium]